MKKATLSVMLLTVLTKALGFIREMVLSYVYGASSFADAYLISQTIPTVVFSFVSAGIATGFIPLYSRILSERGKLDADKYTSNLCNALSICAVGLIVFVLIFVQPVVQLFASGFSGETLLLATQLTRISIFGVCFTGLVNLGKSTLFRTFLKRHQLKIALGTGSTILTG